MFDRRRHDRRRAAFTFEVERVASLGDAPTVVFALSDEMGRLPKILAIVAHPNAAGLLVGAYPPRIAKAVRPDFRTSPGRRDERIVRRHGVGNGAIASVDVDPQHAA